MNDRVRDGMATGPRQPSSVDHKLLRPHHHLCSGTQKAHLPQLVLRGPSVPVLGTPDVPDTQEGVVIATEQ